MSDEEFRNVFFEEAAEHLQAIEDELLILDGDPENSEALNAVFRAAHSIKGSAGMFGFKTLSAFTHHLETLLDLIRKHEADLTDERVELTLKAADEIRSLVDQLADGNDEPPADAALTKALIDAVAQAKGAEPSEVATPAQETDDSFGLFDNEDSPETDESFGLFDSDPSDDDSYGLFDDEPSPEARPGAVNHNEYANYFDEMLKDSEEPAANRDESSPEATAEDLSNNDSEADPDGKFGWLNRPDGSRSPVSEPDKTAAPQGSAEKPKSPVTSREVKGSSLRVSLEKVDELVNQISELVITQAMLQETGASLDPVENERHLSTLEVLERNTRELQESVLSIRLLPVSFLFSRFPRVVRDLSRSLGKDVELILLGEQTELDKSLIEKLSDPLTHLVRNSIDHGIEAPEKRQAHEKPVKGQVIMAAAHEGGNIVLSISDDGAGIHRDKVIAKARENGLAVEDDWSDEQVFGLIFEPGFSTAASVTDVSGRGVGMDVVKRNIKELKGSIEVQSTPGQGSVFIVRLPLTLAITDGMVVRAAGERYVIPLSNVVESLQLTTDDVFEVQGKSRVIRRHGDYLNLRALQTLLNPQQAQIQTSEELAIVVESEGLQMGLIVDELIGQQQIVIKNLETNYRKIPGFSGATVMGDGEVAFILDIAQLMTDTQPVKPATLQGETR